MRNPGFHDFVVHDLLGSVPDIKSRAMFGGYGIYQNGIIFAIIADGRLYFKVNDANRPDYESRRSKPFTYRLPGKQKTVTLPYWELPEEIMEDREELRIWVARSVAANGKRPHDTR